MANFFVFPYFPTNDGAKQQNPKKKEEEEVNDWTKNTATTTTTEYLYVLYFKLNVLEEWEGGKLGGGGVWGEKFEQHFLWNIVQCMWVCWLLCVRIQFCTANECFLLYGFCCRREFSFWIFHKILPLFFVLLLFSILDPCVLCVVFLSVYNGVLCSLCIYFLCLIHKQMLFFVFIFFIFYFCVFSLCASTTPSDFASFFYMYIYVRNKTNNHTHDYSTLVGIIKEFPRFFFLLLKLPLIIFMLLLMFHLSSVHKRTSEDNFLLSSDRFWLWGRRKCYGMGCVYCDDNGEMGLKFCCQSNNAWDLVLMGFALLNHINLYYLTPINFYFFYHTLLPPSTTRVSRVKQKTKPNRTTTRYKKNKENVSNHARHFL